MSKYIFEYGKTYNRNDNKMIFKSKYTVVYENKTYYYCKANGTDELKRITKSDVDTANYGYFSSQKDISDIQAELEKQLKMCEIARLKEVIVQNEAHINWRKREIENMQKELESSKTRLEKLESEINVKEIK